MLRFGFRRITGFTLIEVLVSTIILAIGLLGLASMQTLALKDNQDAFFYAQASSLAYEMTDRIKANASAWRGDILPEPLASTVCVSTHQCNTVTGCIAADMADFDYCAWSLNVQDRIPGATSTVAISTDTGHGVCIGTASALCVSISWARNNTKIDANNQFELEIQP